MTLRWNKAEAFVKAQRYHEEETSPEALLAGMIPPVMLSPLLGPVASLSYQSKK